MSGDIIIVGPAEAGFSPLDEQLSLRDGCWSEGMSREMVWLSGKMGSYAEATEVFNRLAQVGVSQGSVQRRVANWGAHMQRVEAAQQEAANRLPERGRVVRGKVGQPGRLGGSMDGAMVHLREEGWKELKVGCIFELGTELIYDELSGETVPYGRGRNASYVAHLGGPEIFGQKMWSEAKARDWPQYYDTQIVGDGAPWIWRLTATHFFDSVQTLDWGHAVSYLPQAADLLYPQRNNMKTRWLKQAETALFQGHAERIATTLRHRADTTTAETAKTLRSIAQYLETHKRRTQYLELREEGYLLGSGIVESEAKQYKARFTGPGMRWSRTGIENLLPIRTAIMSQQFDHMWDAAYNLPPN